MNINLQKLNTIQTGANLLTTLTADRINAIQDAIKELARGRNIIAGNNIQATYNHGGVNLSAVVPKDNTTYRQKQEWNYCADDTDRQISSNGRIDYQPYRDLAGLEIPLPRPNNIFDMDCEPFPEKPLNIWENMQQTYQIGGDFLEDKDSYFTFTKPGCYEMEFEYTAMHKAEACEWNKNTHSFDLLFYPAVGNKGEKPEWQMFMQYWDWIKGRTEGTGRNLRVIHPINAYVQFTIHGKQRVPNDNNVILEFYDPEKQVGLRGTAGIKYKGDCGYTPATVDSCGFVRDKGEEDGGGCDSSEISFKAISLSSSSSCISFSIPVISYSLSNSSVLCSINAPIPFYTLSTSQGQCSYEWTSMYDPCDDIKADILHWVDGADYDEGDWVEFNGKYYKADVINNSAPPADNDGDVWIESDPCAEKYDIAVCDGYEYKTIYKDFGFNVPISGNINIPKVYVASYSTCKGGEFYTFDRYEKRNIYYNQTELYVKSNEEAKLSGSLEVNVPVGLKRIPKICSHEVYTYSLKTIPGETIDYIHDVSESEYKCGGYSGKVDADITIPVALTPSTKSLDYSYPLISTSTHTCGGEEVTLDVQNANISVPTYITSTSIADVPVFSTSSHVLNLPQITEGTPHKIDKYIEDTHDCTEATVRDVAFEATLDVVTGITPGEEEVTGTVELPSYETITKDVVTSCPEFSSTDVVDSVTPTTDAVSDTVSGNVEVEIPNTLTESDVTQTVTIPVPNITSKQYTLPQILSSEQITVLTDVTPDAAMHPAVTDITYSTTNIGGGTADGTLSVDVPTSLDESTTTVTASIEIDEYETESMTVVTGVNTGNTNINIPSVSTSTTTASGCCYIPE